MFYPAPPKRIEPRVVLPALAILAAIFLNQISFDLFYLQMSMPLLAAGVIFYWGMYKPRLIPMWACFALGLVQDSFVGVPYGVHALGFILLRQLAVSQQRFLVGRSFDLVWVSYAMCLALWGVVEGFVMSVTGKPMDMWVVLRLVNTALIFPIAYTLMARLHHHWMQEV